MTLRLFPAIIMAALLSAASPIAQSAPQDRDEPVQRDRGNRPPPPDLSEAAEKLGISEEDLHAAIRASGGPPPDLAKAAQTLGITEDELKAVMPEPPRRGGRQ
ncbi:MAG: hypothetical protein AAFX77_17350 [Pseudomonadota bacterium]